MVQEKMTAFANDQQMQQKQLQEIWVKCVQIVDNMIKRQSEREGERVKESKEREGVKINQTQQSKNNCKWKTCK